ncbi:MAG: hypothetical protein JNM56_21360 [Planctomycetia bacterium]|nr:hypothetical protein [Planctomycetia bacterium]
MHRFGKVLALVGCLSFGNLLPAAEPPATFDKDLQGEWHVLLGLPATRLGIDDEDTGLIGVQVNITADRFTVQGPGDRGGKLLTVDCAPLAGPFVDENKKPKPGKEAAAKLSGKLSGARRICWVTSAQGLLHVKILTEEPAPRSRYLSSAWGPGTDTLYLVLRRQPVPARSQPDTAVDARRILGQWTAVAHYDDAFLKEPGLSGKRSLSFTGQRVHELDDKGENRKGPVGFWGPYRIVEPAGPFGALDLQLESWAGGGAGLMGRTPSLYAFHGDNLLFIAYNETDRRPEDKRTRCQRLRSDGDHNLFILERAVLAEK